MSSDKPVTTCIICRENTPCESVEHVFPDTIGGAITIKICDPCNKSLGKRIDTPFVNSELILAFRHKYNLQRDGWRDIKNPFKKKELIDEAGREYYVEMKDGVAVKNIKPIYGQPLSLGQNQFFVRVSMPEKNVPADPTELLKTIEKRFGIEIPNKETYVVHTEKMKEKKTTVTLGVSNLVKVFEFIKIAYELACCFSQEYFNDPRAIEISRTLHGSEINKENALKIFTPDEAFNDVAWFERTFTFLRQNPESIHVALFSQLMDGRLKAYIKIFNMPLVITLSDQKIKLIDFNILFFNECKERQGGIIDVIPLRDRPTNTDNHERI